MPTEVYSFPHIRDRASVPGMMWTNVLALLPAVFVSFYFFGFAAFRTVSVALVFALLSEWGMRRIFERRSSLYDGSAVITALLLALLLPPTLPFWKVALGSVVAIVFGKEIFGGLGQNPFNPALVGIAFLMACSPLPPMPVMGPLGAAAVLAGAFFALVKRLMNWEIPFLYLASLSLVSMAFKQEAPFLLTNVLLGAFFLVTDPVTGPLARSGRRYSALAAGAVTAALQPFANSLEAVTYAILLANGLNPWLDRWCRARR